jgi:hypothetical protein
MVLLGVALEPTVYLVGMRTEGGSGHPLCVEPEDGPILPADFEGLAGRAQELYDQDPDSKLEIRRAELDERLDDLRIASAIIPVNPRQFYRAYDRVRACAFYLSTDQVNEVNQLVKDHWDRRIAEGATTKVIEPPLRADPAMSDDYLID